MTLPTGIIINVLSVAIGGLIGTLVGHKLSLDFKENLNMIFGVCAMTMGISSIVLMENMPAVIFSVVVGTAIGLAVHFGAAHREGMRRDGGRGFEGPAEKGVRDQ